MKRLYLIICTALLVAGCAVERYKEVGERYADPDKVCIHYERAGEVTSGIEYRCFGKACENFVCE